MSYHSNMVAEHCRDTDHHVAEERDVGSRRAAKGRRAWRFVVGVEREEKVKGKEQQAIDGREYAVSVEAEL